MRTNLTFGTDQRQLVWSHWFHSSRNNRYVPLEVEGEAAHHQMTGTTTCVMTTTGRRAGSEEGEGSQESFRPSFSLQDQTDGTGRGKGERKPFVVVAV
jgi:hypothetical protein